MDAWFSKPKAQGLAAGCGFCPMVSDVFVTGVEFILIQFGMSLTFRGLFVVIHSYNKNQQDALFLTFILVKNSTCFGQTYCPSSGVLILYSQQLVICSLAGSQHNQYDKYQLL